MKKSEKKVMITDKHHLAMSWCIKNKILVYPKVAINGYFMEVNDNGKIIRSPVVYTKSEMEAKGWELYLYFYQKFCNES